MLLFLLVCAIRASGCDALGCFLDGWFAAVGQVMGPQDSKAGCMHAKQMIRKVGVKADVRPYRCPSRSRGLLFVYTASPAGRVGCLIPKGALLEQMTMT